MRTIYTVVYDTKDRLMSGESTRVARFSNKFNAARFATGKTAWGRPANVTMERVPAHLAQRWGVA